MSDKVDPSQACIREAVCIHTKKIYDSCRDKDCVEDLRVYLTRSSQAVLDRSASVRGARAELLHVDVDVQPASYSRGYYTADIRYFYRVTAEGYSGGSRPAPLQGLGIFDKRVTLFGSEGSAMIFSSRGEAAAAGSNLPEAVVEAVDPMVLSVRVADPCDFGPGHRPGCGPMGHGGPGGPCGPAGPGQGCPPDFTPGFGPERGRPEPAEPDPVSDIPVFLSQLFDNELTFGGERRLYVTLGQFSLVRLERDSQLLIPMYDYCMPTRECALSDDDGDRDPCEAFRQVRFPVGEFFPPNSLPGMDQ